MKRTQVNAKNDGIFSPAIRIIGSILLWVIAAFFVLRVMTHRNMAFFDPDITIAQNPVSLLLHINLNWVGFAVCAAIYCFVLFPRKELAAMPNGCRKTLLIIGFSMIPIIGIITMTAVLGYILLSNGLWYFVQ